jgi:UDP:flavonoid glycosyltransferase YjiC (YdhE family)
VRKGGARVLIAWELGGNLGHVVSLLAVARELRARGHGVVFALRDLSNAALIARDGFAFFPAPTPVRGRKLPTYPSYAAMLSGEAFASSNGALVGALAWRSIMRATRPDLLVADHAPMALLAARGLKIRTATFGVPFSIPVAGAALPVFLQGHTTAAAEEERVLKRLNAALDALRAPRLEAVSDLYRTDTTMVRTLPELDCFGPRPSGSYVSPLGADAGDAIPPWPRAPGQKALVYLNAGAWVRPVLEALAAGGLSTVAYIGGAKAGRRTPFERPGLFVSHVPYKASEMMLQADLMICHANHGTVASAVLAGKPLLMMPSYVEQVLTAQRVECVGVGLTASGKPSRDLIEECLHKLRPGAPAHTRAAELGTRYRATGGAGPHAEALGRLESMLNA